MIGSGGMSTVHRVYDRILLREAAQKLMDARHAVQPRQVERFVAEARVTGQLEHPNIVHVHDFGHTASGQSYIIMKLVEGDTLQHLVERAGPARLEPDTLASMIRIMLKVGDALAFAHSKGVVHRDVTPANVMVGRFGEVYLMDWGVSVPMDGASVGVDGHVPTTSGISGTPAYMAPEQVTGGPIDGRTDVFAFGAVLYFIVTGRPPYAEPTAIQALQRAMVCDWTPLEEALEEPPPAGLDMVIQRAMARDPADRYASMQELQADLEAWLRGRWHLPIRVYGPGEVIVREGEPAEEAFLIVRGTCEARRERNGRTEVLSTMSAGDTFGEMAIFGQVCRTSTVVATSELEVQVVNRTHLTAAVGLDSWVGKFIAHVTARFLDAEQRLIALQDQLDRVNTKLEALESASAKR